MEHDCETCKYRKIDSEESPCNWCTNNPNCIPLDRYERDESVISYEQFKSIARILFIDMNQTDINIKRDVIDLIEKNKP